MNNNPGVIADVGPEPTWNITDEEHEKMAASTKQFLADLQKAKLDREEVARAKITKAQQKRDRKNAERNRTWGGL